MVNTVNYMQISALLKYVKFFVGDNCPVTLKETIPDRAVISPLEAASGRQGCHLSSRGSIRQTGLSSLL